MDPARLLVTTSPAPWLPAGARAEVWVGDDCPVPDPVIIVRLLLTRAGAADDAAPEFFCVPTPRGLDLPSLRPPPDDDPLVPADALLRLAHDVVGREVDARCVGYVRNVVPSPDADYPHPTPCAHVPVFLATATPRVPGSWTTIADARDDLAVRHWWPIVEHCLTARRTAAGRPTAGD